MCWISRTPSEVCRIEICLVFLPKKQNKVFGYELFDWPNLVRSVKEKVCIPTWVQVIFGMETRLEFLGILMLNSPSVYTLSLLCSIGISSESKCTLIKSIAILCIWKNFYMSITIIFKLCLQRCTTDSGLWILLVFYLSHKSWIQ